MSLARPEPRSFIKTGAVALLIAALTACGGDSAGEAEAESRPLSGQDPPSSAGSSEPNWAFSYSGALSGEVSGGVTVVRAMTTAMNSVTITARSFGTDARFSGNYQFPRDDEPLGEKRMLSFNLVLADGTRCQPRLDQDQAVFARVIDGTQESYSAEFSGTISCGEQGAVDVTGHLRN
jgi:hypothetical protein